MVRGKTVRVSKKFMDALRNAKDDAQGERPLRCMWCYTIKLIHTAKCEICGGHGDTHYKASDLSSVYVENY